MKNHDVPKVKKNEKSTKINLLVKDLT